MDFNVSKVVPEGLELLPYQTVGVLKTLEFLMFNSSQSAYNGDEQGLGKTVQTIVTISMLYQLGLISEKPRILCTVPKSMRYTWAEEFNKWSILNLKTGVVNGSKDISKKLDVADVLICTHDVAKGATGIKILSAVDWDVFIIDEAQCCKSRKTKVTQALTGPIWSAAKYHICLSGTPIRNNVVDAFPVFSRMDPHRFPSFRRFAGKFAYVTETPWGRKYLGLRNHEELRTTIRENFFFRRRKDEVLPDLPDKTFQRIILPKDYNVKMPKSVMEEAEALFKAAQQRLEETGEAAAVQLSSYAGLRREQGMRKVKAIYEFIQPMLDDGIPIVLFLYHKSVIAELKEMCKKYTPVVIDGSTSGKARHLAVKNFQEGKTDLFIGQLVAAGTGITLTRSSICVLGELDWVPSTISQAVDRLHRIGQKSAVTIYYFVVQDSIDETLTEAVISKAKNIAKVIENDHGPEEAEAGEARVNISPC